MFDSTLILNADGLPSSVVPLSASNWKESIKQIFVDCADVLAVYDDWEVHSPSITMKVPSVIMLRQYIKIRRSVKFCKENIFLRDGFICQYCGINHTSNPKDLTMDHVVPKFLGGKTNWLNIASSCASCNLEKSHYMKMKPKTIPFRPSYYQLAAAQMRMPITVPHESWIPFIGWDPQLVTVVPPHCKT